MLEDIRRALRYGSGSESESEEAAERLDTGEVRVTLGMTRRGVRINGGLGICGGVEESPGGVAGLDGGSGVDAGEGTGDGGNEGNAEELEDVPLSASDSKSKSTPDSGVNTSSSAEWNVRVRLRVLMRSCCT